MIEIVGLHLTYPDFALGPLSLNIGDGEYFVLLGPSGAGKTTLLEWMAGFRKAKSGRLMRDEADLTGLLPRDRGLGIVSQDAALFPHMSVRDNLAFPLRMRGRSAAEIGSRVDELATLLRVERRLSYDVRRLSSGEARRVALGRAIAAGSRVLLLDEPLDGLDPDLRRELGYEVARLHAKLGLTVLHVTHHLQEARRLADRLGVMIDGQLVQVGGPSAVLARPIDARVARFLMVPNFVEGIVVDEGVQLSGGVLLPSVPDASGEIHARLNGLALRREPLRSSCVPGEVRGIEPGDGRVWRAVVALVGDDGSEATVLEVPCIVRDALEAPRPGERVWIDFSECVWDVY